jgi:drug/metabolite transporter (DMT)-like permease
VCLVWGTTYLAIRIALDTIPPFLMAAFRWLAAGSILVTMLKIRGEHLPGRSTWPSIALLGLLMIGLGNGGVVWAEQTVPSGLTAVLVAALPFWMLGVERFMPHSQRVTLLQWAGLVVGFIGIVVLVWPEVRLEGGSGFLEGVAAAQLACLGWAIGSSYSRRRERDENVIATASFQMLFAGAALLFVGLLRGEWSALAFTNRTAGALAYLVVAGSVVAYSAYAYALKHLPVATVSLYAYINPVIAVVLGTLVLNEPFSTRIVIAGAIVLAGTAMVRR